jgi:hypothetical protein
VPSIKSPRIAILSISLVTLVVAITLLLTTTGFGQQHAKFSMKSADRMSDVVRTPQGNFLVLNAEGSRVEVKRLDASNGNQVTEGGFSAAGTVDYLKLATQTTAGPEGRTMGIAVSCPGGFVGSADDGQSEESEFRICPEDPVWESFEIDGNGDLIGEPQIVPEGASGFLHASESSFVIGSGLLLKDGEWQPINSGLPGRTGDPWVSCATNRELYALYGDPGPRSTTGSESAFPNPDPNYGLFRYELDGSLDNQWTEVPILGLRDATMALVACSSDAAIVQADRTFVSSKSPDKVIELPGKASSLLLNIPSKLPVITYLIPPPPGESRGTRRCAIIEPDLQVIKENRDNCYGVPWRSGDDEYISVVEVGRGDIELREW